MIRGISCSIFLLPFQPSERYPNSQLLGPSYSLFWKQEGHSVTLELITHTLGWVAFGISPRRKMISSDIFTGWVRNGQAYHQVFIYLIFVFLVNFFLGQCVSISPL